MTKKTFKNEYGPSHRARLVVQKPKKHTKIYEDDDYIINIKIKHF